MSLGKRCNLLEHPIIGDRPRLVEESRAVELEEHAGALHGHAVLFQELHCLSAFVSSAWSTQAVTWY